MSSEPFIPPLRELPPGRLAERAHHLRAEIARQQRSAFAGAGRKRILVLAALVLALAAVLFATPALGLRDHIVHLFSSEGQQRPPELIQRYFRNLNVAPPGTAPEVLAAKARAAMRVSISGYGSKVIWVAPTRAGGFCSTVALNDLCDRNRTTALNASLQIAGSTSRSQPEPGSSDVHVFFTGDTIVRGATAVVIRFEDGSVDRTPLVWMPRPIDAGFFVYDLPREHWDVGKRPVALIVEDALRKELARDTKVAGYFKHVQRTGFAPPSNAKLPPPPQPPAPKSQTFHDPAGDAHPSLDITGVTITERGDGFMDFEVMFAGDFNPQEDGPLVALDVDQNPDTGSAFYGTEVEVVLQSAVTGAEVEPALYRAHGWDFRRERHAHAAWTIGPHSGGFSIKRSTLGLKPKTAFNIVAGTVGNHPDTAPDFGTFRYEPVAGTPPPRLGPDRRPPKLLVYDSTGARGGKAKLTYWVLDGRGRTRQVIRIFRGRRLLRRIWTPLADVNPFGLSETTWQVPANVRGSLRFSVRSIDAAGNKSKPVWASLVVR